MSKGLCAGQVALEATRARIADFGGECLVLPADLSDPNGERTKLVERTEARLGPIDILVNNAAVNGCMPFETVSPQRSCRRWSTAPTAYDQASRI